VAIPRFVAVLFTDIVASTRRVAREGERRWRDLQPTLVGNGLTSRADLLTGSGQR
jgi:class 3 adenylate cyclase